MKALKQPVSIYFKNEVLLTNLHSILNGNQISDQFNIQPPSIEEYLRYTYIQIRESFFIICHS